jgi:Domain of unknown function (DUF397)
VLLGVIMTDRLETGLVWHRCESGACVEVAVTGDGEVVLRSTENPDALAFLSRDEWKGFLAGVKKGVFDKV